MRKISFLSVLVAVLVIGFSFSEGYASANSSPRTSKAHRKSACYHRGHHHHKHFRKHHRHFHKKYRHRVRKAQIRAAVQVADLQVMYSDCVNSAATQYQVDPLLVFAMMLQESRGRINAVSHKGASGLMQLMPATARRFGVRNIFDPCENIGGAVRYIKYLQGLSYIGNNVALILAGYNAGEGAVRKYRGIPRYRETMNYVATITANYSSLKARELTTMASLN